MFKFSFYTTKKDDVSAEDFRSYWLGEHAQLQKQFMEKIGVRCCTKCEVLLDHPVGIASQEAYETGPVSYSFIDHWVFNDIESLKAGVQDPSVKAAMKATFASEDKYIDVARSHVLMSVDIAQFYPPGSEAIRATEDTSFVKIYYVVNKMPELTRAQAQLHWNACHGAVSRQDIDYSVLSKYVQAHAIDSTFVEQLVAERGYAVDPNIIGHAEAFIDITQPPKDFPEEEAADVVAMSMEDIKLFAVGQNGQVFVTKDHYVIDKKVIVRPMPSFFSAVY